MSKYIKYGGLMLVSLLFVLFGVHVLLFAYQLNDPFTFVLTFFSSNFIILIGAALALGFGIKLKRLWTNLPTLTPPEPGILKKRELQHPPDHSDDLS